ncbi:MAG: YebC/PmpR family DNA-binding transcriptional regulator [Candidatus Eremiobacteraeota bacterium]|nr:YebC/PmpR family DNA-binding transcriptional regulator [Candidatus Eremiobacteraeota bacterium]
MLGRRNAAWQRFGGTTLSGHSKWHNIKLRKGKADAQRGALFTKLSKELILAAKSGSTDPDANYRLKMAVEKARENNMPQDTIKRAIARASGEGERAIEEIRYEGYGPAGIAVIVEAATDNRNRSAAELRFLFSRHRGSLGESGSVAWMFEPCGVVEVDPGDTSEDQLTEDALIDGVIDVHYGHPAEIITASTALQSVRDALSLRRTKITQVYLGMQPKTGVSPPQRELPAVLELLDALEEHEDTQRVFSNLEVDEAVLEALA